jgi:hypothetical protein
MYETSATIVIPTTSNVELTIIATSFFSPECLCFPRCSVRPIQSQVSLRITLFAHTLGGKCGQIKWMKQLISTLPLPSFPSITICLVVVYMISLLSKFYKLYNLDFNS